MPGEVCRIVTFVHLLLFTRFLLAGFYCPIKTLRHMLVMHLNCISVVVCRVYCLNDTCCAVQLVCSVACLVFCNRVLVLLVHIYHSVSNVSVFKYQSSVVAFCFFLTVFFSVVVKN